MSLVKLHGSAGGPDYTSLITFVPEEYGLNLPYFEANFPT